MVDLNFNSTFYLHRRLRNFLDPTTVNHVQQLYESNELVQFLRQANRIQYFVCKWLDFFLHIHYRHKFNGLQPHNSYRVPQSPAPHNL